MIIRKFKLPNFLFYVITTLIVISFKFFYKEANHSDLRFILSPTVSLVESFTGDNYAFDVDYGYKNNEWHVVIGKSCSGFNLFIISFCMSVFSFIHLITNQRSKFLSILLFIVSAYLFTIFTNSFRIITTLVLVKLSSFFDDPYLHEVIGIVFYFFFLIVYYLLIKFALFKIVDKNENAFKTILDIHNR